MNEDGIPPSPTVEQPIEQDTIVLGNRFGFLTLAWFVVAISSLFIVSPMAPLFFIFFPMGILEFLGIYTHGEPFHYMAIGWGAYIAFSIVLLMTAQRRKFWTLFTVLCVILVVNVVGCRMMGVGEGGI